MKQIRINKNTFICFNYRHCFYIFFFISTYLFTTIDKKVLTLISLVGTEVLRNVVLNVEDNSKFATFLLGTISFYVALVSSTLQYRVNLDVLIVCGDFNCQ